MVGLEFPDVSPVIFQVGSFALRWYSMAYLVGILAAWVMVKRYVKKYDLSLTDDNIGDLAFYATLGIILGGRLGYVFFYGGENNPFVHNPLSVLEIWKGGMSFHGGILGVIIAVYLYARKMKMQFLKVTDIIAPTVPIGIFLGRIANFINDELWGRITNVPWAVRFPRGGYFPRHPSQLYEALLEGILMFIILNILWRRKWVREHVGFVSAMFAILYASFRTIVEQFREPDAQLGFFFGSITMGQMLSIPLVLAGVYVIYKNLKS